MTRIWAIAKLTLYEGIRMRIVLVLLAMLVFFVLMLPFSLRGDETLAGRLQTFLSYSLSTLGVLMSVTTAFFACGTLSRDVERRTIHTVVTKPVARMQILLGKWVGVNLLNLAIVAIAGLTIYGFALFIKAQPENFTRDRLKLEDVIWTARVAATPEMPPFLERAQAQIDAQIAEGAEFLNKHSAVKARAEELELEWSRIPPRLERRYEFTNLDTPQHGDNVYQIRFKLRRLPAVGPNDMAVVWSFYDAVTGQRLTSRPTEEYVGRWHQFLVRAGVVRDGRAVIGIGNPPAPIELSYVIILDGRDAIQILYKVGTFEANYVKALLLIVMRLAFVSALALFFASFTSFPVACFCTLTLVVICIGFPWWLHAVGGDMRVVAGEDDPLGGFGPFIRPIIVPFMQFFLPNFFKYDGVTNLIEGLYIPDQLMLTSTLHTLVYGAALLVVPAWLIFRSREIAETVT